MNFFETGWSPADRNLRPTDEVLRLNQEDVTFGFEAEYSSKYGGVRHNKLAIKHDDPELLHANTRDYPFLEKLGNTERTGNWEVKSKPYNLLSECIRDMKIIKDALRMNPNDRKMHLLKSFHLHMRFPKSCIPDNQFQHFCSWISRIGDVVIFWRLEHRNIVYTLDNWSQHRNEVRNLNLRGTVRLQNFGKFWDLELRGFMSSFAKIQQITNIICTVLENGKYPGYPEFQEKSTEPKFQESLSSFINSRCPNSISPAVFEQLERETLMRKDLRDFKGTMNVVLYGYNQAPYFTDIERASIENYNKIFANNLVNRLVNPNGLSARNIYFEELRNWAKGIQLHHMLLLTLFPGDGIDSPGIGRSFGAEFEMTVPGVHGNWQQWVDQLIPIYRQNEVPAVRERHFSAEYHTWKITPDSSIKPEGSGIEIVSPILFWDNEVSEMQKMLNVTKSAVKARVNESCGFHIHIGLEGFSFQNLKIICLNFLNFESAIDLTMPDHRLTNKYCNSNLQSILSKIGGNQSRIRNYILESQTIEELCQRMNPILVAGDERSRRYYRLNLQRVITLRTIEFRQHEGTIDFYASSMWCKFLNYFVRLPEIQVPSSNSNDNLELLLSRMSSDVRDYINNRTMWKNLPDSAGTISIRESGVIFEINGESSSSTNGFLFNSRSKYQNFSRVFLNLEIKFFPGCEVAATILAYQNGNYFYCRWKFTSSLEFNGPSQPIPGPQPILKLSGSENTNISIVYSEVLPTHFKVIGKSNAILNFTDEVQFGILAYPLSGVATLSCYKFVVCVI